MKKIGIIGGLVLSVLLAVVGYLYYELFKSNTVGIEEKAYLYVPTGGKYQNVIDSLEKHSYLANLDGFKKVSGWLGYQDSTVKAGRYRIDAGVGNYEMIKRLKSGKQQPVKLTFNNQRTKEQFAAYVGRRLEADSTAIASRLNDTAFTTKYGFSPATVFSMFIPNTYEFFWNTNADHFLERMDKEYEKFWTPARKKKADSIKMTPEQVGVLASIVYWETKKVDEMPRVAGAYMNRLHRGIKLQADPTVIFAMGDFTINRVQGTMLRNPSLYNTYMYTGLPPGPVSMPSVNAIDAVLNYEHHNYIFFCAKEDFSGYHAFAEDYTSHMVNARKFQQALNVRGIK